MIEDTRVRPDDYGERPRLDPRLDPRRQSSAEARGAEWIDGVSFAIGGAAIALTAPTPPGPVLARVPVPGEVEETPRLDPSRATVEPGPPPAGRQRGPAAGIVGSLAIHLLPLVLLFDWTITPVELAAPIPVRLVIEAPPPPPPAPPAPKPEETKPPPGRLASEDIGQKSSPPPEAAAAPAEGAVAAPPAPSPPAPSPPAPMQIAAAVPPPKLIRPPKPAMPAFTWRRLDLLPQAAPRETRLPGPAATRDEYLAYCMSVVRRHFDLLPPSFIAGRRGQTIFRLAVLDDGTIARITLVQRSPYPDIDARIEEAVNAVRKFPPLPQWLQQPSAGLILRVSFPDGL